GTGIGAPLPRGGPEPGGTLPLADQLGLLRADGLLVCPLRGPRLEATLLLGPRRGWAYDSWTVEGLRAVGHQAGLAFENLTLATARAHADKLAALGQAAARIAHEIRNPLAAARSLVQLVGQTDGARELTEPAVGELDRIGRLVSDLLAFSRRDDVRAREEVDVAAVCRAALAEVAPLAQALNVDVV